MRSVLSLSFRHQRQQTVRLSFVVMRCLFTLDRYHCKCDVGRMLDIAQSMGGQPGYFLRWNPDSYKSDKPLVPDMHRLETLYEIILTLMKSPCDQFLQVGYLYYDHFDRFSLETLLTFEE
jgi:hypothetical protein